jgi:TPR repeat protein
MAPMIITMLLLAAVSPADLETSCNADGAAACDELGNRVHDGLAVPRNLVRAAELFRKACKGKNQDGCADAARALALGEGQQADPKAALPRLEQMCKSGHARACGHLGDLFSRGLGSPQDSTRADGLLAKACDAGVARACSNLASVLFTGGSREQAEDLAEKGCDLGDPAGCAYLGDLYARSNDTVRASLYFSRACEGGFAHGCAGQGFLLVESGIDPKRGRELLQKGCDGGEAKACKALRELK